MCCHSKVSGVTDGVTFSCVHQLHVLSAELPGGHSLCLPCGSFIYCHPSLFFTFPLTNQESGSIGVAAHGWKVEFTRHEGLTLPRGWLCQKWKPLDIPGTHLHKVTPLLNL